MRTDLNKLLDEDALQSILLAKIGVVGLHRVEELHQDRRHASKKPGSRQAFRQFVETHRVHVQSVVNRVPMFRIFAKVTFWDPWSRSLLSH